MKTLSILIQQLRYRLARVICPDCFFNRDASLEIDRLTVENEDLKARLQAAGLGD